MGSRKLTLRGKITKMKFWCLLLALGLVQLSTFMEAVEAAGGRDTDGDGITDDLDDGDGIPDFADKDRDTDGDGVADVDDEDDDNDGILDVDDADDDGDGVPDVEDEDHPDFNDEL